MDTVSLGIDVSDNTPILGNVPFQSSDTGNEPAMPNPVMVVIDGYPEHDERVTKWNTNILRAGRSKLPGMYFDKVSDADFANSVN